MTLVARQIEYCNYLRSGFSGRLTLPGWSLKGACAVTGNATQENLCQPVTAGAKDHGSDGMLQWRLDRLTDMQTWCVKNFGTWQTIQAQAAFTLYETARDYASLDADLRAGTKSIATLATDFNRVFERSADDATINAKRILYANDVMALVAAQSKPVGIPPIVQHAGAGGAGVIAVGSLWAYLSKVDVAPIAGGMAIGVVVTLIASWLYSKMTFKAAPAAAPSQIPTAPEGTVTDPASASVSSTLFLPAMLSRHAELMKSLVDAKTSAASQIATAEAALSDHKKLMASTIASLQEQLDLAKAEATDMVIAPAPAAPTAALQMPPTYVAAATTLKVPS